MSLDEQYRQAWIELLRNEVTALMGAAQRCQRHNVPLHADAPTLLSRGMGVLNTTDAPLIDIADAYEDVMLRRWYIDRVFHWMDYLINHGMADGLSHEQLIIQSERMIKGLQS